VITCPTVDQINTALKRAATAARELTPYPDRVLALPLPNHASERRGESWWLIGHIRVLGKPERWEVWYDPLTDQGRLRSKRRAYAVARDVY
jgi:hypothetical protein